MNSKAPSCKYFRTSFSESKESEEGFESFGLVTYTAEVIVVLCLVNGI